MRLLFTDVETSSDNSSTGAVLEFAGILTDCWGKEVPGKRAEFRLLPHADAEMQADALKINGYTEAEWLLTANDPKCVTSYFHGVEQQDSDIMLAGWNVHFDERFLRSLGKRLGFPLCWRYRLLDVQSLLFTWALQTHDGAVNLTRAAEDLLGLKRNAHHSAMQDAQAALDLYRWYLAKTQKAFLPPAKDRKTK